MGHCIASKLLSVEAYVIPFLFGSFFTVCHPYIDVHFLKCFSVTCVCHFLGGNLFIMMV